MKIEKRSENSYRIRKKYKGKTYTVNLSYKPTQKEALELMAQKLNEAENTSKRMDFASAYKSYIDVKSNILSPSTIKTYKTTFNALPDKFKNMNISDIAEVDVQKVINDYSVGHSPKTTKNVYGFITAILGLYRPQLVLRCKLPQQVKNNAYLPTETDIKRIMDYAKGSNYEIALKLACLGMRRSEICALTPDDIVGNTISINKALVLNTNKEWVIKPTKTTESTREIYIPDDVVELIKENGLFSGHPGTITKYLNRVQDALEIPRFGIHKMRHFYASYSHSIGIPDKYIMEAGGWKTTSVLNSVYKHALKDKNEDNNVAS